jgi:hypothetical protein
MCSRGPTLTVFTFKPMLEVLSLAVLSQNVFFPLFLYLLMLTSVERLEHCTNAFFNIEEAHKYVTAQVETNHML